MRCGCVGVWVWVLGVSVCVCVCVCVNVSAVVHGRALSWPRIGHGRGKGGEAVGSSRRVLACRRREVCVLFRAKAA